MRLLAARAPLLKCGGDGIARGADVGNSALCFYCLKKNAERNATSTAKARQGKAFLLHHTRRTYIEHEYMLSSAALEERVGDSTVVGRHVHVVR